MSHIETGNTKLSLAVLVKIALALEVNTDDLLFNHVSINKSSLFSYVFISRINCDISFGFSFSISRYKFSYFTLQPRFQGTDEYYIFHSSIAKDSQNIPIFTFSIVKNIPCFIKTFLIRAKINKSIFSCCIIDIYLL